MAQTWPSGLRVRDTIRPVTTHEGIWSRAWHDFRLSVEGSFSFWLISGLCGVVAAILADVVVGRARTLVTGAGAFVLASLVQFGVVLVRTPFNQRDEARRMGDERHTEADADERREGKRAAVAALIRAGESIDDELRIAADLLEREPHEPSSSEMGVNAILELIRWQDAVRDFLRANDPFDRADLMLFDSSEGMPDPTTIRTPQRVADARARLKTQLQRMKEYLGRL